MIQNDKHFSMAQQAVQNLQMILMKARSTHTLHEYRFISEPILLEIQQREQDILAYLSAAEPKAALG
jgi:hypothetical protein